MKKRIVALIVVSALIVLTLGACGGGGGSQYPSSPVTVVVPYDAGGGTDLVARALVDSVKGEFPKGIAVENRSGGGGAVGMSFGQNSKPDGNVITMITVELVTLPHTGTGGDITYEKFAPICMVNSAYSAITVKADSPYNSLDDLIADAGSRSLQVGNSGVGAIWHLAASGLEQAAGVTFTHVPFEGAAPAITSLLGGHIDAVSVSYAEVSSQIAAGELKALAVLAPNRLEAIPDVPTAKELGYDIAIGTWRGLAVPKETPAEIVSWLETTFTNGVNSDAFTTFMSESNNVIELLDSKTYGERIAKDFDMFGNLISSLGL